MSELSRRADEFHRVRSALVAWAKVSGSPTALSIATDLASLYAAAQQVTKTIEVLTGAIHPAGVQAGAVIITLQSWLNEELLVHAAALSPSLDRLIDELYDNKST